MREVSVSEITKNIREMCIEANHFLSPDMKQVFDEAVSREESPLGKQILNQLEENLRIAGEDMIPICQDTGMAVVFLTVSYTHLDVYKRQWHTGHLPAGQGDL